jgi:hypothetical protein
MVSPPVLPASTIVTSSVEGRNAQYRPFHLNSHVSADTFGDAKKAFRPERFSATV